MNECNVSAYARTFGRGEYSAFKNVISEIDAKTYTFPAFMGELQIETEEESSPELSGISITCGGEKRFLAKFAVDTLLRRYGLNSKTVRTLPERELCELMRIVKPYIKGETAKVLVKGDTIHAVMSDRYRHIYQSDIIEAFSEILTDEYEDASVDFIGGYYSHEYTAMVCAIDDDSLLDVFREKLKVCGYKDVNFLDSICINLELVTSDIGNASVTVVPRLYLPGIEAFKFAPPVVIPHRDGARIEVVKKDMKRISSCISDGLSHMGELTQILIMYPHKVFTRLIKEKAYALPARLVQPLEEQFEMFEQIGEPISGFDFVKCIAATRNSETFNRYTFDRRLQIDSVICMYTKLTEELIENYDKP